MYNIAVVRRDSQAELTSGEKYQTFQNILSVRDETKERRES